MRSEIEQEVVGILRSRGQEPKGRLCKDILVPVGALADESGADLVQAVVDFTNWAMSDGMLLPSEFPVEALCAYFADYYLAQVNNGGHAQWACNGNFEALTVKTAGWGLEAMGAQEYLAIYHEFVRLMGDPNFAKKILASESGFNGRYPEEDALNSRFYALDPDHAYPMLKLSATWLKSLPILRALEAEALERAKAEVIAANPYHAQRLQQARAAQEKKFFYWAPRKLCAKAGVELVRLTAGNAIVADGQKRFAWFMQTSDGLMAMAMINASLLSGPKARLYRVTGGLQVIGRALAEVAISKEEYASHVPRTY